MKGDLKSFFNDLELNKTSSSTSLDVKHLNIKTKVKYYSTTAAALLIGATIYFSADAYIKQDSTKKSLIENYGYSPIGVLLEPSFDAKKEDYKNSITALTKEINDLETQLQNTKSLKNGEYPLETFLESIKKGEVKVDWEKVLEKQDGWLAYDAYAINSYFANNPTAKIKLGEKELSFEEIMNIAKDMNNKGLKNNEDWVKAKITAITKIVELSKAATRTLDNDLFDDVFLIYDALNWQEKLGVKDFKFASNKNEKIEEFKDAVLNGKILYFIPPSRGYKIKANEIFKDEYSTAAKSYKDSFLQEQEKIIADETKLKETLASKIDTLKIKNLIQNYYRVDIANYENSKILLKKLENIESSKDTLENKINLVDAAMQEFKNSTKGKKDGK